MSENVIFTGTLERVGKQITSINDSIAKISGIFLPFEGKVNYGINITYLLIIIYIFSNELNFCYLIGRSQKKEEGMTNYTILILLSFLISIHMTTVIYKKVAGFIGKGKQDGGRRFSMSQSMPKISMPRVDTLTKHITISNDGNESIIVSLICLVILVISFIISSDKFSDELKTQFNRIRAKVFFYMLLHAYPAYIKIQEHVS